MNPTIHVLARLFLNGGEAGHTSSAAEFVRAAGGARGRVTLLLQGGPNSSKYLPRYTDPWMDEGLGRVQPVMAGADGQIDLFLLKNSLIQATAVYIGGGNTAVYHHLYGAGEARDLIRTCILQNALPYGGLSAGMLLAGDDCPLDPEETGELEVRWSRGLGLFSGMLCEPHYTAEHRASALSEYLRQSGLPLGYGVDDDCCLVLEPGCEPRVIGGRVTIVENR